MRKTIFFTPKKYPAVEEKNKLFIYMKSRAVPEESGRGCTKTTNGGKNVFPFSLFFARERGTAGGWRYESSHSKIQKRGEIYLDTRTEMRSDQ